MPISLTVSYAQSPGTNLAILNGTSSGIRDTSYNPAKIATSQNYRFQSTLSTASITQVDFQFRILRLNGSAVNNWTTFRNFTGSYGVGDSFDFEHSFSRSQLSGKADEYQHSFIEVRVVQYTSSQTEASASHQIISAPDFVSKNFNFAGNTLSATVNVYYLDSVYAPSFSSSEDPISPPFYDRQTYSQVRLVWDPTGPSPVYGPYVVWNTSSQNDITLTIDVSSVTTGLQDFYLEFRSKVSPAPSTTLGTQYPEFNYLISNFNANVAGTAIATPILNSNKLDWFTYLNLDDAAGVNANDPCEEPVGDRNTLNLTYRNTNFYMDFSDGTTTGDRATYLTLIEVQMGPYNLDWDDPGGVEKTVTRVVNRLSSQGVTSTREVPLYSDTDIVGDSDSFIAQQFSSGVELPQTYVATLAGMKFRARLYHGLVSDGGLTRSVPTAWSTDLLIPHRSQYTFSVSDVDVSVSGTSFTFEFTVTAALPEVLEFFLKKAVYYTMFTSDGSPDTNVAGWEPFPGTHSYVLSTSDLDEAQIETGGSFVIWVPANDLGTNGGTWTQLNATQIRMTTGNTSITNDQKFGRRFAIFLYYAGVIDFAYPLNPALTGSSSEYVYAKHSTPTSVVITKNSESSVTVTVNSSSSTAENSTITLLRDGSIHQTNIVVGNGIEGQASGQHVFTALPAGVYTASALSTGHGADSNARTSSGSATLAGSADPPPPNITSVVVTQQAYPYNFSYTPPGGSSTNATHSEGDEAVRVQITADGSLANVDYTWKLYIEDPTIQAIQWKERGVHSFVTTTDVIDEYIGYQYCGKTIRISCQLSRGAVTGQEVFAPPFIFDCEFVASLHSPQNVVASLVAPPVGEPQNDTMISWDVPASVPLQNPLHYVIQRSLDSGPFNTIVANTTSLSYIDNDLAAGSYIYRVKAVYEDLTTSDAHYVNSNAIVVPVTTIPSPPTPVNALQSNSLEVTVSWPDTANADAWTIERRTIVQNNETGSEVWIELAASIGSPTYTDTTVAVGDAYDYRVKAINTGTSEESTFVESTRLLVVNLSEDVVRGYAY